MTSSIAKKSTALAVMSFFEERVKTRTPSQSYRFSREICTFEENVKLQKIFFIKFSIKMVLIKMFVAIILTKLQRFESREMVKTYVLCRRS